MKKPITILMVVVIGVLLGWNLVYSEPDPFTLVSGMTVWILFCLAWVIALFNGYFQTATVYITIILFVGSAGSAVYEIFEVSTPLATVEVDNSTKIYPMPNDPNPAQKATIDWMEGKWVIQNGQGAQKVFVYSWASSIVSFLLFLMIAWILAEELIPEQIRGISIPIEFILLVVFLYTFKAMLPSFAADGISKIGKDYLLAQWFGGFLQNRWWPMLLTAIMSVWAWIRGKSVKWPVVATIVSAMTWLFLPLLQTVFNPTIVSWTSCSYMVQSSDITNALCQEAFVSGSTAMLVLSMAWTAFVSLIKKLFWWFFMVALGIDTRE